MPCVTPLRLALALGDCPEADQPALAAEALRVKLDFVTVAAAAAPGVLSAAPRLGVLTPTADGGHRFELPGGDVVAVLVRSRDDVTAAAEQADLAFVVPADPSSTPDLVDDLRTARAASSRAAARLLVFADVSLAELAAGTPTGSPAGIASLLQAWQRRGLDGFRVLAGSTADVELLTHGLVPALLENDAFRRGYDAKTLRGVLGLPAPSRAAASSSSS